MMQRRADSINIGAADIYFQPINPETGDYVEVEYYLGLTQDGANIKYTINWHEIKADQYGENLLDAVLTGEDFACDVNLLETTKDRIGMVVATAKTVGNKDNPSAVTFGRKVGLRASRICGRLRFHPVSMGMNDKSMDVIVYMGFNQEGLDLSFKKDKEWIIPCKWRALIDDRRPDGDSLFRIGEDTESVEGNKIPIEFKIAPLNENIAVGVTLDFSANAVFEDYSTGDVTKDAAWTSSNSTSATISMVSGKAVVVAKAKGTTIITATYLGYSSNTTLVVTEA